MSIFTNTFGGSAVSPADVSYAAYSFSGNLVLYWPAFSAGNPNVAARFMNLTATAGSLNVSMPDATLTSVGQDVIIFNAGSQTFNVVNFSGGAIATIAAGQTYYLMLNDNTTQAGGWQTVQFGVGTGSASAAALAGAGLLAIASTLNVNFTTTTLGGNTTLTSTARAMLQVWNGGTGTITLPAAASVGNGFFFPFSNDGSGSVTIKPNGSEQIDGASSSVFTQTQSGFIVCSGSAWYTCGKSASTNFAVTVLNLNVAGSADVTETSAQAQNIIQQFTGVLTGNINVIVPNTPQIYFAFNNTTGAYTLEMKTVAGSGITIAQGTNVILYCDGTNVVNAFTSSFGGSISIAAGSAGSPNFSIIGSLTTGIFSPAANQIAFTAGGYEVMNFAAASGSVNFLQSNAAASGNSPNIQSLGSDINIGLTLTPKGSGSVNIAKVAVTGGAIDSTVIGGSTPAAITGTTVTGTTLVSTVATGTAPLTVASTTQVANLNAATAGTATNATNTAITDDTSTNATMYPTWVTANTGNLPQKTTSTELTFNPSTGLLSAATFSGAGTGLTGTAAGLTAGTVTTNANLTGGVTSVGNVATVVTNANLTGDVTSVGNATTIKTNVALAGNPTTTTQTAGDNSTKIATTAFATAAASGGIKSIHIQVFAANSTYTPTTGISYAIVECVGGGAGGGSGDGGSGGGGGEYAMKVTNNTSSQTVTIGAKGTGGGSGSPANGTDGGNTSFGSICTANGGKKGLLPTGAGGVGGSGGTGDISIPGQSGGYGANIGPCAGGSSHMGAGGAGSPDAAVAGDSGKNYGGGGAGTASAGVAGGDGAQGVCIVTEYCTV